MNQEQTAVPSLTRMHLSSIVPGAVKEAIEALQDVIVVKDGIEWIKDENDTFRLERREALSLDKLKSALPQQDEDDEADGELGDAEDKIVDYKEIAKRIVVNQSGVPPTQVTSCFNHDVYFENLRHYQAEDESIDLAFGRLLLYSEVITSTNTILEK